MNTHSDTKASDILEELVAINEDIQNTLLIGEKVAKIYETGQLYNHLKTLITPEYLTDEEFDWLRETANSWNNDVIYYAKEQTGKSTIGGEETIDDIEQTIKTILDDLIGGLDDMEDYLDGV